MSAQIAVLALLACTVVAFLITATFPRWFVRPILRDKLLRLLDDIDWDRRDGHLPKDDKAVLFMRNTIVRAVVDRSISTTDVLLVAPRARKLLPARPLPKPRSLSPDEQALYNEYQRRFDLLVPAYVMLGSWSGFAVVMVRAVPLVLEQIRYIRARRNGRNLPPTPTVPRDIVESAVGAITRHNAAIAA